MCSHNLLIRQYKTETQRTLPGIAHLFNQELRKNVMYTMVK